MVILNWFYNWFALYTVPQGPYTRTENLYWTGTENWLIWTGTENIVAYWTGTENILCQSSMDTALAQKYFLCECSILEWFFYTNNSVLDSHRIILYLYCTRTEKFLCQSSILRGCVTIHFDCSLRGPPLKLTKVRFFKSINPVNFYISHKYAM